MNKKYSSPRTILLLGLFSILVMLPVSCRRVVYFPDKDMVASASDLVFNDLAKTWDEAVPLGNAVVGSLVWEKEGNLRMALDRTDLWDLRPADSLSGDRFKFSWVTSHVDSGDYLPVQEKMDVPYDRDPAPSKIPGAALEFGALGEVDNVHLYIGSALCEVSWKNGARLYSFIDSDRPVGWFLFENVPEGFRPEIVPPPYSKGNMDEMDPVTGQDLSRLGYPQGEVIDSEDFSSYHQEGWGGFSYDVAVKWKNVDGRCIGAWSVTSSFVEETAASEVKEAFRRGIDADRGTQTAFWKEYWAKSSVSLPDSVLQKQYDNEMYKFGSASREDSYPISLQAVWTADNGKLPPWKGDYHHDLNTQLSYWPAYAGNHLKEELGYLNTLWAQREVYHTFTRQYFEKDGMAIPGVCTLTGEPMGGWIQYSLSQTTSAWLAQHFYLHWKYSADEEFLRDRGYPFVKDVAIFLEQQTVIGKDGYRILEYSTSPEIFDNTLKAWFPSMTNYDNALVTNLFKMASEMAGALSLEDEASRWDTLRRQMKPLALAKDGSLAIAEGFPYDFSHRHFSHAMSIHPLGLLNWEDGEESRRTIQATIDRLEEYGPSYWTGYSYAWFANMRAWAYDGEGARRYLRDFAECFCLPNTFHANGDQSKTGKSRYLYRPFTLEGNFAFASGIQEMLLQSHTDTLRIFPAIPDDWKDVSFNNLRARGAFLVSAERRGGETVSVKVVSEKGGDLRMISPFDGSFISRTMEPGEEMNLVHNQSFLAPVICPEPTKAEISAIEYYPLDLVRINCPDQSAVVWARKHLVEWYGKSAPKVEAASIQETDLGEEDYELTIDSKGVSVTAKTLMGIRYAMYSLRQIAIPKRGTVKVEGWIAPRASIKDSPALDFRGIHICWFHETEPWEVERLVRMAAYYKMNYAVIESWGSFRSDIAPWYGWPDGSMTKAEVARIKAIADDLGITLIPQINVFGHATMSRGGAGKHSALDLDPEYQPLFEPVAGWNWCLSNPETRKLLSALIKEQMEAFGNPPYFHIGGDEAEPPSCPDCISKPYSQLFLDHIKAMNEVINANGARAMMWHDMLLERGDPRWSGFYANGTKETAAGFLDFPRDIIICDWFYGEAKSEYPTLDYFKGLGFKTLTCPWMDRGGIIAQGLSARQGKADGILGTLWHHYFGNDLVRIYLNLANSAWNAGADSRAGGDHFRTHLRQVGWDMKVSDPRHTGIYYDELPPEPVLDN